VATGLAWRWAGGDRLRLVLVFAAAWIVTEFLRGVLFTGFPWNPLGVSLLLTPASIFSTLAGTYALSGLAALIAGTLYLLARRQWRTGGGVALGAAAAAGVAALLAPSPGAGAGGAGPHRPAEHRPADQIRSGALRTAVAPPRGIDWPPVGSPARRDGADDLLAGSCDTGPSQHRRTRPHADRRFAWSARCHADRRQ
jgi:apolipoprotein N-acyltransferase